jgi:mono/diheme cytochrome c family protein
MKTCKLAVVLCIVSLSLAPIFAAIPPASDGLAANPAFQKNCAKCHGKSAEGRHFAGPSLISPKVAAASADELRNIITNGKNRMPKFSGKLTAEEIDNLVAEIQALNKK